MIMVNLPFLLYMQEELSLEGYRHHLESRKAAPPLTEAEQHLKELNENEVGVLIRVHHNLAYVEFYFILFYGIYM